MTPGTLIGRSLRYYWRTNLAMALGVATAVAVLGGALLVGASVRESLRGMVERRLGAATHAVRSPRFFREALGGDLGSCPFITVRGTAVAEGTGRRAARVQVYGVDARFFAFHGRPDPGLEARDALPTAALAAELGASPGETLLIRVERTEDVSPTTLFGERADLGRTLRLRVKDGPGAMDFSLRGSQQQVRAVFVPLRLLQRSLDREGRANALLLAEAPGQPGAAASAVRRALRLDDLGLRVRELPGAAALAVESASALLTDDVAAAAAQTAARWSWPSTRVLTYLANRIGRGERGVPYSLVAGLDDVAYARLANRSPGGPDEIVLNDWTARDLGVGPGDEVELDYYVWREEGALETAKASFRVAAVVPLAGAAADRDLTPAYPGITDSLQLADWDPPFPVELGKIRPRDEDYWRDFRTTPKAFVPLARAQDLWGHRLGRVSSVRVYPAAGASLAEAGRDYGQALLEALDPADFGFTVEAVREEGLRAATGSTDFGEYFTYFSFFIVVSALLLATMFFRLGVEQRVAEVGLLGAVGFKAARVRNLLLREGLVLAALGSVLGAVFAAAYASFVLLALRTVWKGAVGTDELRLHVTAGPLAAAAGAGIVVAGLVVAQTLRGFRHQTVRSLLSGVLPPPRGGRLQGRIPGASAVALLVLAAALVAAAGAGVVPHPAAFFGAGASLLASGLLFQWLWLTRRKHAPVGSLVGLGLRSATYRPGRSLLCMALVSAATFVIVALGAFQHAGEDVSDPRSGAGGYPLYAESLVPLAYPLDTPAGREAMNLADADELHGVAVARFRVRPGDDASCLNLYRPGQPRMLGATGAFLKAGRFRFASVRAEGEAQEANPWTALDQVFEDGAIPAIADQNSITYSLHKKLGDDVVVESGRGPVRLRLVAALSGSLFQSELIVSEANFLRMFPDDAGYRFFLFDVSKERAPALTTLLESRLGDQGLDVSSSAERLREFHAVENTYLSTFQALGGLGLLLGTVGLGTVLLRNALERRREMALARAVGFRREQLRTMVLAENLLLLFAGLGLGTGAALVAVLPALLERGGFLPLTLVLGLLLAVAAAGVAASAIAVAVVARFPLLQALRAD